MLAEDVNPPELCAHILPSSCCTSMPPCERNIPRGSTHPLLNNSALHSRRCPTTEDVLYPLRCVHTSCHQAAMAASACHPEATHFCSASALRFIWRRPLYTALKPHIRTNRVAAKKTVFVNSKTSPAVPHQSHHVPQPVLVSI